MPRTDAHESSTKRTNQNQTERGKEAYKCMTFFPRSVFFFCFLSAHRPRRKKKDQRQKKVQKKVPQEGIEPSISRFQRKEFFQTPLYKYIYQTNLNLEGGRVIHCATGAKFTSLFSMVQNCIYRLLHKNKN